MAGLVNGSKRFNSEQVIFFTTYVVGWPETLFFSIFCNFSINNKCVEYNYRVYVS